ncbi:MAG: amylo-alpha-1,6-glucosidase [Bacteroidales bacterium]|jgi:predicted glycogen debranching enzyme|nr:amylo-alpha-1,6-glucosidase [Bacteroidales bacterium]
MSYLKFDKIMMINLEQSLSKEVLRTNRSGAYHSSTIVDCNTRKSHGLLVIPVPELGKDNHVLLSSLDETVVQHGAEFNMGLHKYQGDVFVTKGHKYIRSYDCESTPRTIYRVGGVILSKEKLFVSHENRILIRYTLLDAHSPTKLRFRPFLAFRNVNALAHENPTANSACQLVENGVSVRLYDGYPNLYMQFNKKVEFVHAPDWYRNIEYHKEQERGYDYKEDLLVPGYFELSIEKGETIIFSAGISEIAPRPLKRTFEREESGRTKRTSLVNCLKNSARQFYKKCDDDLYLISGYPWFGTRARDMFIAMPGCTLGVDEPENFEAIMQTAAVAIRHFIRGENIEKDIAEMDAPDVLLWAMWAIQQYAKEIGKECCLEKYGALLSEIIDFIMNQRHENLFLHKNGLLYTNGRETPVSWMNSSVDGKPLTPRSGYLVEFNALWYNALRFVADMQALASDTEKAKGLEKLAATVADSFISVFYNEFGYLFDYVAGNIIDWSVRPNMIFAASLDYSPLDKSQRKSVLDYVTKELLTPKGIRSLSPKSEGYNPYYAGEARKREYAYHQGTAWPWLFGAYFEAYLKIFHLSGLSFVERLIAGFDEEMNNRCIGSISELFDGNPPYEGRGAISYAMNTAEILRIMKLIKKYSANSI